MASDLLPPDAPADHLLAELLDRIDGYLYIKDQGGRYLFANAQVRALYGATPQQIVGAQDAQFMDTTRSARVLMNDRAVLEQGAAIHDEEELCLHNGVRRGFRTTKLPILDAAGQVVAVCGLSTDITQRNWASGHLVERNHLLGTVLSNIDAHIYVKDHRGNYLYANEKTLLLYGRTAAEVIGRSDADLLPAEVAQRLAATDREVIGASARHAGEEVVVGADGKERHYWSIKLPLELPGQPTGIIGFSTEITELLRLRQTLERQRITDALTGLPNRLQLEQELALELRLAQRDGGSVALVMLDIDQFKHINTHFGQEAGDQLLREAAQRLRQALPANCCLAAPAATSSPSSCPAAIPPHCCARWSACARCWPSPTCCWASPGAPRPVRAWPPTRRMPTAPGRCWSTPKPRCTWPRSAAAISCAVTAPTWAPPPRAAWHWSTTCAARWRPASSNCTTSPRSAASTAPSPASRPCCAGTARPRNACRRWSSSRWPSRWASWCRSASGWWNRLARRWRNGVRKAWAACLWR